MNSRSVLQHSSIHTLVGVAVILLMTPFLAEASQHGKGGGHKMPTFAQVDLDGDGMIVATEFYEARGKHMAERAKAGGKMKNAANAPTFESIDLDNDGKVSTEEFASHQEEMRAKHRSRKDKKPE